MLIAPADVTKAMDNLQSQETSNPCSVSQYAAVAALIAVLVLLIVSVAVHFALVGLGLWFFGAEGSRTPAFSSASSRWARFLPPCSGSWAWSEM